MDEELDSILLRAKSGNRVFRSATILRLFDVIEELQAENQRLHNFMEAETPDYRICPKCGEYVRGGYVCWNCKDDDSDEEGE